MNSIMEGIEYQAEPSSCFERSRGRCPSYKSLKRSIYEGYVEERSLDVRSHSPRPPRERQEYDEYREYYTRYDALDDPDYMGFPAFGPYTHWPDKPKEEPDADGKKDARSKPAPWDVYLAGDSSKAESNSQDGSDGEEDDDDDDDDESSRSPAPWAVYLEGDSTVSDGDSKQSFSQTYTPPPPSQNDTPLSHPGYVHQPALPLQPAPVHPYGVIPAGFVPQSRLDEHWMEPVYSQSRQCPLPPLQTLKEMRAKRMRTVAPGSIMEPGPRQWTMLEEPDDENPAPACTAGGSVPCPPRRHIPPEWLVKPEPEPIPPAPKPPAPWKQWGMVIGLIALLSISRGVIEMACGDLVS